MSSAGDARLVPVTRGVAGTGERWTMLSVADGDALFTRLDVLDADGQEIGGGGFGGPALYPGMLVNTYVCHPGSGRLQIAGRADPSVAAVRLELRVSDPIEVSPAGDPSVFGVRFFAAFALRDDDLVAIQACDAAGNWTSVPAPFRPDSFD